MAASQDRRRRLRLEAPGALPAHRPGLRARHVRHGLLRRPQLHLRHLHGLARARAALRHAGAGARPDPAAVVDGGGDQAHRRRGDLLRQPAAPVLCRAPVGDARPPDRGTGGVERGHLDQPQPGRQFRRRASADRRALRPGARIHRGLPQAVGELGGGRRRDGSRQGGLFADPAKVQRIEHDGRFFKSRGPLNVVRSPQNGPAILQAGTSPKGVDFAAKYADAIFAIQPRPQDAARYFAGIKGRMAELGRDPEACKILFGAQPIIGASEAEAREKQELHNSLVPLEGGMTILSAHADFDLSRLAATHLTMAILSSRVAEVEDPLLKPSGQSMTLRRWPAPRPERRPAAVRRHARIGRRPDGGLPGNRRWRRDRAVADLLSRHDRGIPSKRSCRCYPTVGLLRTEYKGGVPCARCCARTTDSGQGLPNVAMRSTLQMNSTRFSSIAGSRSP